MAGLVAEAGGRMPLNWPRALMSRRLTPTPAPRNGLIHASGAKSYRTLAISDQESIEPEGLPQVGAAAVRVTPGVQRPLGC
ncbi:hypothetical protein D3C87_2008810 [compost metagenome]